MNAIEKFLYYREVLKMSHTMKKAFLLEPLWKKYEGLKFSNTLISYEEAI